ncbi:hypothetical protein ZWY2020_056376 [Hordeum vulgare]|nr:hypothetical protein ZWY2020_056376 [Hordeum vulgare]
MKAQRDNVGLRTFIDICVEEKNANNRGKEETLTPLGYDNVVRNKNRFKNKRDVLKKDYVVWKTLTQKATCIGFDPITYWKYALEAMINRSIFDDVSVINEYARVAPPSSQVGGSQIFIDDDAARLGCDIDVTHVTPKAKGRKKRSCPYSPSSTMVQKIAKDSEERIQFKRIADLWEKRETSRNSATSEMKLDPVRDEIKETKEVVVNDGGIPGSEVYFHALELFTKKEHRDVFSALKEDHPSVRLGRINMAWETFMKKN